MAGLFYKSDFSKTDKHPVLTGDEAKHAVLVRRMKTGDELALTNGRGLLATGRIIKLTAKPPSLELSITEIQSKDLPSPIHLVSALPKGDRLRTMLDMATQLGMTQFTPINYDRSVSKEGKNSVERWQRICLEAMKQCRRVWLPKINPTVDFKDFLSSLPKDARVVIASQYGEKPQNLPDIKAGTQTVLLIGPEGGFTDEELQLVKDVAAIEICLSNSVLRTETAAVAATAMIAAINRFD